MSIRVTLFVPILMACIVCPALADVFSPDALSKSERQKINRAIKSLQYYDPRFPGGNVVEAEDERIYIMSSLEHNGSSSIAVQFRLEAGNGEDEYLLVFNRKSTRIAGPMRIGGDGYRHIAINRISEGRIRACV